MGYSLWGCKELDMTEQLPFFHFQVGLVVKKKKKKKPCLPIQDEQETQLQSLGREDSPEEGNGNPFQYSCLEDPMDRGA